MKHYDPNAAFSLLDHGFIARVVDVENDPEKAGRAKIRIIGMQDDEAKIPDKDLFWARPVFPVTNPSHGGAAGQQTGLRVGSTVVGFFADVQQQIPLIWGTIASSGTTKPDGTLDHTTGAGIPKIAREIDENEILKVNIIEKAKIQTQYTDLKTIGTVKFERGDKILDTVLKIDPNNLSGSVGQALNGLSSISGTLSTITNFKNKLENAVNNDLLTMVHEFQNVATELQQAANTVTSAVGGAINYVENQAGNIEAQAAEQIKKTLAGAVGPLIGNVTSVSGAKGVLKQLGSFNFAMSTVMGGINSSWGDIKSQAKQSLTSNILGAAFGVDMSKAKFSNSGFIIIT